jgi:hypothetical protein
MAGAVQWLLDMGRFALGLVIGVGIGIALANAHSSTKRAEHGRGVEVWTQWDVVRDDETLICSGPVVFWKAKQIECQ